MREGNLLYVRSGSSSAEAVPDRTMPSQRTLSFLEPVRMIVAEWRIRQAP